MAILSFQDLSFEEKEDKVRVNFLRIFYFYLNKEDLNDIGTYQVKKNEIEFPNTPQPKAEKKFYVLLEKGFKLLKNSLNQKPAMYIHKNSGIPLIGNVAFGLVDRGTNVIEVKPVTGCNIKCVYCSVDEDKRPVDFVIEESYLAEEFKKLVKFKEANDIEAHIASQGEPMMYAPLADLIRDISQLKEVKTISIDTNGSMLTEKKVDELIKAGLNRFNLSINALDPNLASKIAGMPCNIGRIQDICRYIRKKTNLIITPVLIPGINDDEMPKIIEFAKEIGADIGIQNFMVYRLGRNPVKPISFEGFYAKLKEWDAKYHMKLIKTEKDFNITKTKQLPKPFRKGEVIEAEIICKGRLPNEKLAVAKDRTISVSTSKEKGKVRLRIERTKHNIFIGTPI
ncbi:MAG TPA: radical SAM protein [Candidatus Nanoarchaeia archaeon]|nr:radical SAM protein [Candidatus Nanoarchaeia archaeon]